MAQITPQRTHQQQPHSIPNSLADNASKQFRTPQSDAPAIVDGTPAAVSLDPPQVAQGCPAPLGLSGSPAAADDAARDQSAELATHHKNGLRDQTSYLPFRQIIICFGSMQLCVMLSFLDQTIVSTALPSISAAFNAGRASSWVASAYLLTSTAFQPVWGRLSDIFGRKATLLSCVVIFLIGSLACALAQSMVQLIVFRGLQGVGGGGFLTLVQIIVSDIVSLRDRAKYQGITEAAIAISNGIGPVIGGLIADNTTWRWVFWLNLPVSALAFVVLFFYLPLKHHGGEYKKKFKQIDYLGCLLTIGGSAMIVLPLNWGGTSFAWVSAPVLGCLIGGFLTFVVFFFWEGSKFVPIPVVPPRIFNNRTVNCVMCNTFSSGIAVLGQSYYIPQFLQIVRGDSAILSGALVIPLLLSQVVAVASTGQLIARTGRYKPSIVVGYVIWTCGLGALSTVKADVSSARLAGFLVMMGLGQGQTLQSSMVAAQAAVPRSDMSAVTSTRNFLRTLGAAFSVAIAAAIINNTLRGTLIPLGFSSELVEELIDDPTGIWHATADEGGALVALSNAEKAQIIEAYLRGFRIVFLVFVGLVSFNAVSSFTFLRQHSLNRADEVALKQRGKELVREQREKRSVQAKEGGTTTVVEADLEKGAVGSGQEVIGEEIVCEEGVHDAAAMAAKEAEKERKT